MSRRKLKMLFWAVAAVLAFIPFLQGCAADDGRTDGSEGAGAEGQQNEQGMQDEGSSDGAVNDVQAQDVQYGQVVSVDGDEVTVLLGEYAAAAADADSQSFRRAGTARLLGPRCPTSAAWFSVPFPPACAAGARPARRRPPHPRPRAASRPPGRLRCGATPL